MDTASNKLLIAQHYVAALQTTIDEKLPIFPWLVGKECESYFPKLTEDDWVRLNAVVQFFKDIVTNNILSVKPILQSDSDDIVLLPTDFFDGFRLNDSVPSKSHESDSYSMQCYKFTSPDRTYYCWIMHDGDESLRQMEKIGMIEHGSVDPLKVYSFNHPSLDNSAWPDELSERIDTHIATVWTD